MQRRTIACSVSSSHLVSSSHVKVSSDNRNALRSTQDASGSVRKHQGREQSARGAFQRRWCVRMRPSHAACRRRMSRQNAPERPREAPQRAPCSARTRQGAPGKPQGRQGTPGKPQTRPEYARMREGWRFSTPEDHLMGQRRAGHPWLRLGLRVLFIGDGTPCGGEYRGHRTPPRRAYGASSVERRCALGPSRRRLGRRHGRRTLQTPVAFSLGFRV